MFHLYIYIYIYNICTQIISIFEIVTYVLWDSSWASESGRVTIFYFSYSKLNLFQVSIKDLICLTTASVFLFSKNLFLRMEKKKKKSCVGMQEKIIKIKFSKIKNRNFFLLVVGCVPNHDQIPTHFLSLLWIMIICIF